MRAILQRVSTASIEVDGEEIGRIGRGMLVLLGIERNDDAATASRMADKLAGLRMFEDAAGKMNLAAGPANGEVLVVSQFTLAASLDRGRRPSFNHAAPPDVARPLVEKVVAGLAARGLTVATGRFGANMQVHLINDGPVTFVLDVREGF